MSQTVYCPQCGAPNTMGQRFCEQCGAALPQSLSPNPTVTSPPPSVSATSSPSYGGLFDPRHMAYVVKEKFWDWGSGPIYDAQGNEIGRMKRKLFSIRKRIEFLELDGTLAAYIAMKIIAIRPTYSLFDPQGNLLGRFSKTLFSLFRPKFYFKDPAGNIIFMAQGKFMGFDFKIYAGKEADESKLVAEIHKADRWRDVFFGGVWDFSDTYGVKVINPQVDRRLLLGFVIAIDNVLHDN